MTLTQAEERGIWRRIEAARRYARESYHPGLKRAIELYEGKHYGAKGQGQRATGPALRFESIVANKLKRAVEIKVAQTAFQTAEFFLVPTQAEHQEAMAPARDALTFEWTTWRLQAETKRCLRDAFVGGLGIAHTGWLFVTQDAQGAEERRSEGLRPPVRGEGPDPAPDRARAAEAPVDRLTIAEDRPLVRRIPPLDWFCDPQTDAVLENARFVGYTERVSVESLKADPRLSGVSKIRGSLEYNGDLVDPELRDPSVNPDTLPKDLLLTEIHHYWEKQRKLHVIVSEETQEPLLIESWPHEHRHYPFEVLRVPGWEDRCYPIPPLVEVEHPQQEINQQRSLLAMQQRAATPKVVTAVPLSEANRQQLRSEKIMGIVELESPGTIDPLRLPGLPAEAFASAETAERDIGQSLGLDEYAAGTAPTKRVTEGEVAAIQASAGARAQSERQDYETFVGHLAAQVLALLQQNSTATRSLPIFDRATGEVQGFRDYTRFEIQGEFIVSVYAGSTEAPNRQAKLRDLSLLLQSAGSLAEGVAAFRQLGIDLWPAVWQLLRENFPELRSLPPQATQAPPPALPAGEGPAFSLPGATAPGAQPLPESLGDAGSALSPELLAAILGGPETGPSGPGGG